MKWMRIEAEPERMQGSDVRHGGLRVNGSGMRPELWAGWHGLLERFDGEDFPAVFRVSEAP